MMVQTHTGLAIAALSAVLGLSACAGRPPLTIAGSLSCSQASSAAPAFRVEFLLDSAAETLRAHFPVRLRPGTSTQRSIVVQSAGKDSLHLRGALTLVSCAVRGGALANARALEIDSERPVEVAVLGSTDRHLIAAVTIEPGGPDQRLAWGRVAMGFTGGVRGL